MEIEKKEVPTPEENKSNIQKLAEELAENNDLLKSTNDPKKIIFRGLLYGLSTVIGATILVGIGYSFIKDIPFLGEKVDQFIPSKNESK